jgi:hypothetical protein
VNLVPRNQNSIWAGNNITLGVASQSSLSFLRVYYSAVTGHIYPYLTAIIDVSGGHVNGITWDNACVFCGGGQCEENTFNFDGVSQTQKSSGQPTSSCFITTEECNKLIAEKNTNCDLLLYVVWTGTDARGDAFLSSAYRFSAFPSQQIQDRLTRNLPQFPSGGREL